MSYERILERESDDEERDPTPSFPPMRVVPTDGETVDEITLPLPLVKCGAVSRARKVG
jgi:hypothetical protein